VVAFSDEEGVRFQSTFLGSRAFAGTLTPDTLATTDADGTTLGQARAELSGYARASPNGMPLSQALVENGAPSEEGLLRDAIRASMSSGMRAYVEAHIEQGPILEGVDQPLAAVTAIAGQTFLTVTMQGSQGHAGTVPMPMRHDTLAAAAEIVTSLERRCQGASAAGLAHVTQVSLRRQQWTVWPSWRRKASCAPLAACHSGRGPATSSPGAST
jgi:allantoate deiminase